MAEARKQRRAESLLASNAPSTTLDEDKPPPQSDEARSSSAPGKAWVRRMRCRCNRRDGVARDLRRIAVLETALIIDALTRNVTAHRSTEGASVLAPVNVASSPSSPCSTRVPSEGTRQGTRLCARLRVAPGAQLTSAPRVGSRIAWAHTRRSGRSSWRRASAARPWNILTGYAVRPPAPRGAGRLPGARSRGAPASTTGRSRLPYAGGTPKIMAEFLLNSRLGCPR
jgi:hypothetical protein